MSAELIHHSWLAGLRGGAHERVFGHAAGTTVADNGLTHLQLHAIHCAPCVCAFVHAAVLRTLVAGRYALGTMTSTLPA